MAFPGLIIITDLDGTLLDEKSYGYQASLPAIRKAQSVGIPLILCSSKTHSEILPLWKELALADPFIVENGGAIYCPAGYFPFTLPQAKSKKPFRVLVLGTDVLKLRRVLAETAARCRARVRSFGSMSVDEIAALTGLTKDQAALAGRREYDEPFLVEEGDRERLVRVLIGKGLTVTRGDRFYHVTGNHSKGEAVKTLLDLYRRSQPATFAIGLGNSANDLPLFNQVDRPILVKKADGSYDLEVLREIPNIERTAATGPHGWREAIEKTLADLF